MSCQSRLAAWRTGIRTHLPLLSQPQVTVLALWSSGRVAPPQGASRAATVAGVL
jgi:hypothetical protein